MTKEKAEQICDCYKCDRIEKCQYKHKYQRWPREVAPGALGLCPKLKDEK